MSLSKETLEMLGSAKKTNGLLAGKKDVHFTAEEWTELQAIALRPVEVRFEEFSKRQNQHMSEVLRDEPGYPGYELATIPIEERFRRYRESVARMRAVSYGSRFQRF